MRTRPILRLHAALPVCAAMTLSASAAWAQAGGLLPSTGFGGRGGNLRGNLEQFLPKAPPPSVSRAWRVAKSVRVELGLTDNPGGARRSQGVDVFTSISPDLFVSGDTARLKVRLGYAPQLYYYPSTPAQNRISQYLNGSVLATIVPDAFYLDLRGLISEQSRTGGLNQQQNSQFLSRQNAVQSSSFSITPSLQHRFGGWGTAQASYSLARTIQDSQGGLTSQPGLSVFNNPPNGSLGYGTLGNLTTQRERASFVTGENLGRFNNETVVEAIQYDGNGAYRGAYRNSVSTDVGYAVSRSIVMLAGVGYQSLRYNGNPGYRISEPTWNVGTRLTPNADSSLTLLYGHRDGSTQFSFDGAYSPTARTRIFGRYSTGIGTSAENQQNLLASTGVGPGGFLVDRVTGAPVTTGSGFGVQNGLSRIKRLSFTALLILDRDSFSASISNEERETLTTSTSFLGNSVPAGTRSTSTVGTLSWQHDLNPSTSVASAVSYGVSENAALLRNAGTGTQNTTSVTASLNHTFTETLTGSVRYAYSRRSGGQGNLIPAEFGGNTSQNLLVVGLRKSF